MEEDLIIKPINANKLVKCFIDYTNKTPLKCGIELKDFNQISWYKDNEFHKEWYLKTSMCGGDHFNFFTKELIDNHIDLLNLDEERLELWNLLVEHKKDGTLEFELHDIFYKMFGGVKGLLQAKFTNTSNVKRIAFHAGNDIQFVITNHDKESEMKFPFSLFYIDGSMYSTTAFYFELFDPKTDCDLKLSAIPMYLNEKEYHISNIYGFCYYYEIPAINSPKCLRSGMSEYEYEDDQAYMILRCGIIQCDSKSTLDHQTEKLKTETPMSFRMWTKSGGEVEINTHKAPTVDPTKLIIAVYSNKLDEVISKFPQDKILKKSEFTMATYPPAKDMTIMSDALADFEKIAEENNSKIGYIRKYTYYTDEQKRINEDISEKKKNHKWELYQKLIA